MSRASTSGFQESGRPEVALITNHGYAGAEIPIGGAPDTGGQVVYVNALARALESLGYCVTVFARGGFPHFKKDRIRQAPEFLSDHVRYVFVPGGGDAFIRKEDIAVALDEEVDWLDAFVRQEAAVRDRPPWAVYDFINTHYWDAAVMGMRLVERWRNDVAAAAVTDLLTGSIPPALLNETKDARHWRALGAAPAYHLGALLLETDGSPAAPLIQRVRSAAGRWAKASWQARDRDADRIVAAVEQALTALADEADPPASEPARAAPVRSPDSRDPASSPARAPTARVALPMRPVIAAEALGAALLALCRGRAGRLERELNAVDRHVWTPHSLAVLKQENFRNQPLEVRRDLRFCERRHHEQVVCDRTAAFAATSAEIAERLRTHHRVPAERIFFFPPCVDRTIFRAYAPDETEATYRYLAGLSGVPVEALRSGRIVFETSRMDETKRKDLLLDAFAHVARVLPDVFLFIGGGPDNDLVKSLLARRDAAAGLRDRAFLTGFIPEKHVGPLFSIADIYASASEMEGFGMSVSQAAAAGTAVVCSDLIPFAVQYVAEDAMIVPAGDMEAFGGAMLRLLEDDAGRARRAERLAERVKVLDWEARTSAFVEFLRERGIAEDGTMKDEG